MHIEESRFQQLVSGAKSRTHLWERILRRANVKTMLEVGVWKAEYAQQILTKCEFIQRYYMIDPWRNLPDWNKPFNVSPEVFEKVYAER